MTVYIRVVFAFLFSAFSIELFAQCHCWNEQLPKLSPTTEIKHEVFVHGGKIPSCDVIVDRDLLSKLGIDACFSDETVKWPVMQAVMPVKPCDATKFDDFFSK